MTTLLQFLTDTWGAWLVIALFGAFVAWQRRYPRDGEK